MKKLWCKLFHRKRWMSEGTEGYSNRTTVITYRCLECGLVHEIDLG